jgi:hypothetical protein
MSLFFPSFHEDCVSNNISYCCCSKPDLELFELIIKHAEKKTLFKFFPLTTNLHYGNIYTYLVNNKYLIKAYCVERYGVHRYNEIKRSLRFSYKTYKDYLHSCINVVLENNPFETNSTLLKYIANLLSDYDNKENTKYVVDIDKISFNLKGQIKEYENIIKKQKRAVYALVNVSETNTQLKKVGSVLLTTDQKKEVEELISSLKAKLVENRNNWYARLNQMSFKKTIKTCKLSVECIDRRNKNNNNENEAKDSNENQKIPDDSKNM